MTTEAIDKSRVALWTTQLADEVDAVYLYERLAHMASDPHMREVLTELATVERKHVKLWENIFAEHGIEVNTPKPSIRARFYVFLGRLFRPSQLLPILVKAEADEVNDHLRFHRESTSELEKDTARTLAQDSAEHVKALQSISGSRPGFEPWHLTESGGYIRNIVYGFNDGLTANFGLVAGVIGANAPEHIILVTGVAGLVADALSMGASGYLAAKSEAEVFEHEIAKEREELLMMPEVEEEELALIYQAKGIERERAKAMAADVMSDIDRGLEEKVREELNITDPHASPFREAWVTGVATAVGAFIPVFPIMVLPGVTGIWVSFGLSMFAHFLVGAARTVFTGRPFWRSGWDMFSVGFGVAIVGYLVGEMMVRFL